MNKKYIFILILTLICFSLNAETNDSWRSEYPVLGSSSVISMVTVYPGREIYSLFGHSSFRVYDPEKGIDWMFNYGTFDFDDPLFVPKFVRGKLDYYLSVDSFRSAYRYYSAFENRKVVEQVLNLEPEEKDLLFDFLLENSLEENRYYKYDFINDNCSTRIADVIMKCFGNDAVFPEGKGENSFRSMIDYYLKSYPFLNAGIDIVLGSPSDRLPEGLARYFLPVPLIEGFDLASLKYEGGMKKLVKEKKILYSFEDDSDAEKDTSCLFYISLLLIISEVFYLLLNMRRKVSRFAVVIFSASEILFLVISGTAGILLFYLWFFSDHMVPNWNFNILWLSPLSAVYVLILPFRKIKTYTAVLSRILFVSSLLYIPVMAAGIQPLPSTLFLFYLYAILIFFRRGEIGSTPLFGKILQFCKI